MFQFLKQGSLKNCLGVCCILFLFLACRQNAKPAWDADSTARIGTAQSDIKPKSEPTTHSRKAPDYVYDVWEYVAKNGDAKRGYVGGRTFQNREKRLPKTGTGGQYLKYQEWDVHPKVQGKNRGAERLVTGSDKSAYYTKDHYKTFIRLDE